MKDKMKVKKKQLDTISYKDQRDAIMKHAEETLRHI